MKQSILRRIARDLKEAFPQNSDKQRKTRGSHEMTTDGTYSSVFTQEDLENGKEEIVEY